MFNSFTNDVLRIQIFNLYFKVLRCFVHYLINQHDFICLFELLKLNNVKTFFKYYTRIP